jgi:hypothetical protein
MEPSAATQPNELEITRCAAHPERTAVALCDRCGDYHCDECHKRVAGKPLCARCRALPGIDYLEDTRQLYWGKRDGFIWYLGLLGVFVTLVGLPNVVRTGDIGHLIGSAVWLAFSGAYLAQYRPARRALIPLTLLDFFVDTIRAAFGVKIVPSDKPMSQSSALGLAFGGALVGLLIAIAAYRSPRNKLAFKIPVDDSELQRVYDRYRSNPLAVRAAVYSVVVFLIPFGSLFTLLISIRALQRADPKAWPPRSGRLPAQIGLAVSSLGLLCWGALGLKLIVKWIH